MVVGGLWDNTVNWLEKNAQAYLVFSNVPCDLLQNPVEE